VARDFVDWVIDRWAEERPDLETSSIAVVGRLMRIASLLERRFEELCRQEGISFWALTMLTALRRAGDPYRLTPSQLQGAATVSAAAITKRIGRLEELGLVERLPDPADRRGALVGLTPEGLRLVDRFAARYLEEERAAIAALDDGEQQGLAKLLRQVLLGLEGPRTGPTGRAG
jgi:DNA-binding MarR family transcriptional regulator